jgi:hypothetical protein
MAARTKSLAAKNIALFQHTGGYPLPMAEDSEGTGVLLALLRQGMAPGCRAIGPQKNVFHFDRLKNSFHKPNSSASPASRAYRPPLGIFQQRHR